MNPFGPRFYTLIGQTAVPMPDNDVLAWAMELEHSDRVVFQTRVLGLVDVSTVFLGMDMSIRVGDGPPRPPLLFESMVFWYAGDGPSHLNRRYSTWAEAEAGHHHIVSLVVSPAYLWASITASARLYLRDAWDDLRDRLRELRAPDPDPEMGWLTKSLSEIRQRTRALTSRRWDW